MTNPGSGRPTATTTTATRGSSSATRETDLAACGRRRARRRDAPLQDPRAGFVWEARLGGPLMLIAGGSGIVPLRAMLRHRIGIRSEVDVRLLYSSRSLEDVIYRSELLAADAADRIDVTLALTRQWPQDWSGQRGRITPEALRAVSWPPRQGPLTYICGPSGFVEGISANLVRAGHDPSRIRTERFGPTGN